MRYVYVLGVNVKLHIRAAHANILLIQLKNANLANMVIE